MQNLTFTHAHLDHFGFASFLVKELKCTVRLPLAEWLSGWKLWHEREQETDEQFAIFLKRNGASDDDAARIMEAQRKSKYLGLRPPREFIRIRDGDVVTMGKREWRVITAGGHSVEHALFHCEQDNILIAGDQVLSHMTPSVIVPAAQPEANPMKEYLDLLTRLEALPADTLVLPSHGLPFRGLHTRLAQMREHHLARLDDVASGIAGKTNAFAIAQEVFPAGAVRQSAPGLRRGARASEHAGLDGPADARGRCVRRDQLYAEVTAEPASQASRQACSARKGGRSP